MQWIPYCLISIPCFFIHMRESEDNAIRSLKTRFAVKNVKGKLAWFDIFWYASYSKMSVINWQMYYLLYVLLCSNVAPWKKFIWKEGHQGLTWGLIKCRSPSMPYWSQLNWFSSHQLCHLLVDNGLCIKSNNEMHAGNSAALCSNSHTVRAKITKGFYFCITVQCPFERLHGRKWQKKNGISYSSVLYCILSFFSL